MILRDFDHKQITKRRSEELRTEFKRLEILKWKTVVSYGDGEELVAAERMLSGLREVPRIGRRKRGLDCDDAKDGTGRRPRKHHIRWLRADTTSAWFEICGICL